MADESYRVADSDVNANALAELHQTVNSEGYKVLERLLDNKLNDLIAEAVEDDDTTHDEWQACKGGIKTLRFLLDISESVVSEFEKMKKSQEKK